MRKIAFALVGLASSISFTLAQPTEWHLDKAHSGITFSVSHMVISEVTGKFKDFDIRVKSGKEGFTDSAIEAVIKVTSINTENEKRDGHLKSDDFFNAEKFPEIKFKSTAIEKVDNNKYKIHGDLTIRDITKRVTFDATLNGSLKLEKTLRSGWKATTSINRFDYGLKWNRVLETGGLVAGDVVNITLNLELTKQGEA